jgi:SHS2 domain-containing protein
MPARWRQLPHTADVRLQGWGREVGDAVGALLAGVQSVVFGRVVASRPARWERWAPDPGAAPDLLLVELLGEAVYRLQDRREAVVVLDGDLGSARLGVVPLPDDAKPLREIKAVTYNDPVLRREPDGTWTAEVTLDV